MTPPQTGAGPPTILTPAIVDVGVVYWEFDWDAMRFTSVSPEAEALLGFPVERWYERSFWYDRLHPDDRDQALAFCRAATAEFKDHQFQYRLIHADGTVRWVHDIVSISSREPTRLRGVLVDITPQRRTEERLAASEQRFREMANQAPVLIWMTDADRTNVFFNDAWLRFVGRTAEQGHDDSWAEDLHPEDRDRTVGAFRAAHDHRVPLEFQYRLRRHDGAYRWVLDRGAPRYEGGEFAGYLGSAIDIHERVMVERQLRESEARFRFLAENARDIIARYDANARCLYVSPACQTMLGRRQDDIIGREVYDFIHPDDHDRMRGHHAGALYGVPQTVVLRMIHADGHPVWTEASYRTVRNEASGATELVGTVRDISLRKLAEDRLRESTHQLQLTIDSVPAMIARVGADRKFRYCNMHVEDALDVRRADLVGRSPEQALSPELARELGDHIDEALHGSEVDRNLVILRRGEERIFRINYVPDRTGPQQPASGCFILGRDITERHRDKVALRDALAKQDELMRELSHRVKNSLGGLLTLIDLCERRYPTVPAFADAMRRRVRAQADVHSILTTNRYESIGLRALMNLMLPTDAPGAATFTGPDVRIPARQATAMGIVIHELMCNSLLHGALGTPGARLDVLWDVDPAAERRTALTISWQETGIEVDRNAPPSTGTSLIEGFLRHELRGSIAFDYADHHLHHTLRARLDPAE